MDVDHSLSQPTHQSYAITGEVEDLCAPCRRFTTLASQQKSMVEWSYLEGREIQANGQLVHDSKCPLCLLIARTAAASTDESIRQGKFKVNFMVSLYTLQGFKPKGEGLKGYLSLRPRAMSISKLGTWEKLNPCIAMSNPQSQAHDLAIRPISPLIDFGPMRRFIEHCQRSHVACHRHKDPHHRPLRNVRVIDCDSRKLISLTSEIPYLVLSYVWGQVDQHSSSQVSTSGNLPTMLPSSIEDALRITKKLGFKFLWVDRYCINQKDRKDVETQVLQMDLIYRNAICCIIAAAASHPGECLPGVSEPRAYLPQARLPHMTFTPISPDARTNIECSRWASRGWTYQEEMLSTVRIYICRHQAFLRCCHEELREGQQRTRTRETWASETSFGLLADGATTAEQAWAHIALYNARHLTHSTDAIVAISGILAALQDRPHATQGFESTAYYPASINTSNTIDDDDTQVEYFYGLPLELPNPELCREKAVRVGHDRSTLINGNTLASSLATSLFWKVDRSDISFNIATERRLGLPSWSWASRRCRITPPSISLANIIPGTRFEVATRDRPDEQLDWQLFCWTALSATQHESMKTFGAAFTNVQPMLTIYGAFFPVLIWSGDWSDRGLLAIPSLDFTYLGDLRADDQIDDPTLEYFQRVAYINYGRQSDGKWPRLPDLSHQRTEPVYLAVPLVQSAKIYFLIVVQVGGRNVCERVGIYTGGYLGQPVDFQIKFRELCENDAGYRELAERGICLI